MSDLHEAIQTGTAKAIVSRAWDAAGTRRGTIVQHNEALVILAEAIVAARDKPEDVATAIVESFYEDRRLLLLKHPPRNWLASGDRVTIIKERP